MQRIIRFEDIGQFDITTDVVVAGYGGAGAHIRRWCSQSFDWYKALGVNYKRGFFSGRNMVAMTGDSLQWYACGGCDLFLLPGWTASS